MSPETTPQEAQFHDAGPQDAAQFDAALQEAVLSEAARREAARLEATLPPDAAERDAAKRNGKDDTENIEYGDDIHFLTRSVSDEERAAVIAVLTAVRTEESLRMKRVERRVREPWARSQRVPEGISDLLIEG